MKKIITVMFIFLLLAILLSGCTTKNSDNKISDNEKIQLPIGVGHSSTAVEYEIINIEGMPCIFASQDYRSLGITCDWSQWNGK